MITVTFLMQGTHHIADHEQDACKSMKVGVSTHMCLSKERLEELSKRLREGHIGSLDSRRLTVRKGAKCLPSSIY